MNNKSESALFGYMLIFFSFLLTYTGTNLENWTLYSLNQEPRCKRVYTYIPLSLKNIYKAELMMF